jgi:thymidylate synthase (FAD)
VISLRDPRVYVLGYQQMDQQELARFLDDEGLAWDTGAAAPAEKLVEAGGRLCYMSFDRPRPGGVQTYLGHIKETRHGSVVEHAVFTLLVTGVSRGLTHELVRYRAGFSPSEMSQRYVGLGGGDERPLALVPPPVVSECIENAKNPARSDLDRLDAEIAGVWSRSVHQSARAYDALCDLLKKRYALVPPPGAKTDQVKAARGAARSVLPEATETKLQMTCNARMLRHFLEERCSPAADAEIRRLANLVFDAVKKRAPLLFADYEVIGLSDGTRELRTPHRKI